MSDNESDDSSGQSLSIQTHDGFAVQARVFPAQKGSVDHQNKWIIINSATAVPQRFYSHFARFMSKAGYSVITYDYRGVAESSPKTLVGFQAKMRDWVLKDMQAVFDWVQQEHTPTRLHLVGHSFGGQAAGLLTNPQNITSMLTISSQSGYWWYQGGLQKLAVLVHSYTTLRIMPQVIGYMPWSWFGGEDIPAGVAMEWAGWCRDPRYLLGDDSLPLDRYQAFTAPILALSIDDDDWGTRDSVTAMMSAYPNMSQAHIVPSDYAIKSIGHMGYFRPSSEALWKAALKWLTKQESV